MWYLIVSIPDLCNLTYFVKKNKRRSAGGGRGGGSLYMTLYELRMCMPNSPLFQHRNAQLLLKNAHFFYFCYIGLLAAFQPYLPLVAHHQPIADQILKNVIISIIFLSVSFFGCQNFVNMFYCCHFILIFVSSKLLADHKRLANLRVAPNLK